MNARDIRLLTFYTDAIQALCEAQKESYSANVPKYLSAQIGDIARTMCTDLAGHVDPTVREYDLDEAELKAIRMANNCDGQDCTKCPRECLGNRTIYVPRST